LNGSDADVSTYTKIFSLKSREEIEVLEAEHAQSTSFKGVAESTCPKKLLQGFIVLKIIKLLLRLQVSCLVMQLQRLLLLCSEETFLDIFDGVPQFTIAKSYT
jgi:tyrosyl-tRNA synthetase